MYINRSEYKYLLPLKDACELQHKLDLLLQRDAHCLQAPYRIRSLYFDTPDNRDYHENLAGLECRRKIRLRTYDPGADTCKLELKEKKGEFSHKTSLFLRRTDAERLIQGETGAVAKPPLNGRTSPLHRNGNPCLPPQRLNRI